MTLLETTYKSLHDCDLTKSTRDFSTKYLNRNANWYSYKTHKKRDFSVSTAFNFITYINANISNESYDIKTVLLLNYLKNCVEKFLQEKHAVMLNH